MAKKRKRIYPTKKDYATIERKLNRCKIIASYSISINNHIGERYHESGYLERYVEDTPAQFELRIRHGRSPSEFVISDSLGADGLRLAVDYALARIAAL